MYFKERQYHHLLCKFNITGHKWNITILRKINTFGSEDLHLSVKNREGTKLLGECWWHVAIKLRLSWQFNQDGKKADTCCDTILFKSLSIYLQSSPEASGFTCKLLSKVHLWSLPNSQSTHCFLLNYHWLQQLSHLVLNSHYNKVCLAKK